MSFLTPHLLATSLLMALATPATELVIDDRTGDTPAAALGTAWRLVTDGVMGGVSQGRLSPGERDGRNCLRLQGKVSTANNGGFVQMVLDLPGRPSVDATPYAGVAITVSGNGETYNVHLRTSDLWLPWQSYRASFVAQPEWQTVHLPFTGFEPYRTAQALQTDRLRRLGIVAIGRDFEADVCVARVWFYTAPAQRLHRK